MKHEFVVSAPFTSVLGESSDGFFGVFLKVGLEVTGKVDVLLVEEFGEEDEGDFVIQAELDIGIVLLDSLDFEDEFLDEQ